MSETRTEWGVLLMWPDGEAHVELADRDRAEWLAYWHNDPDNESACNATVVCRTVTVTDWTEAEG